MTEFLHQLVPLTKEALIERCAWGRQAAVLPSGELLDPFEPPPINIEAVFAAFDDIERGFSYKPKAIQPASFSDPHDLFDKVDHPSARSVEVITRALRQGKHDILIAALRLEPFDMGCLLARKIAQDLTSPAPGSPPISFDTYREIEWVVPAKKDIADMLRSNYPPVYEALPKHHKRGNVSLTSDFWRAAGLDDLPRKASW